MQRIVIEDGLNSSIEKTGIGSYTRRLLDCLDSQDHEFEVVLIECKLAMNIRNYYIRRFIYRIWKNLFFEPLYLRRGDILHITHFRTSFLRRPGVKRVYTIHDLVAKNYAYCLPPAVRSSAAKVVDQAVAIADQIIVPNVFIKNELAELYPELSKEVNITPVTYSAVSMDEYSAVNDTLTRTFGKYFLSIGTIEVRKNIETLVTAFDIFCENESCSKSNLVIVGKPGFGADAIIAMINESKFSERIHYLSFVSNEMLSSLLAKNVAFVFPSIYEGFGLPALEAIAMKKPVIVSDIGTFRSIGRNHFHFYGEPMNAGALANALSVADRGQFVSKNPEKMLKTYSSENVAKSHLKVYRACTHD